MATRSSIRILENPMDRGDWWATVQSMGSQRVRHDLATKQQPQVHFGVDRSSRKIVREDTVFIL